MSYTRCALLGRQRSEAEVTKVFASLRFLKDSTKTKGLVSETLGRQQSKAEVTKILASLPFPRDTTNARTFVSSVLHKLCVSTRQRPGVLSVPVRYRKGQADNVLTILVCLSRWEKEGTDKKPLLIPEGNRKN